MPPSDAPSAYVPPVSPDRWLRRLLAPVPVLWPLKALGTMAFMLIFFWAYFAILRQPSGTPLLMPRTAIDALIPVSVAAFPVYAALWFYVSLPPALLRTFRQLAGFTLWISLLCLSCLGIFWLFPTAVPPAEVDWTAYPELSLIKGIDAAGNACPSLHVASAVFAARWLAVQLRQAGAPWPARLFNLAFCLAILWSTVATRQHVVLDVLAGTAIGLLFAWPALRSYARTPLV